MKPALYSVLILILTACSSGNISAPVQGKGTCANTYFPVQQGLTWNYKSTDHPYGNYQLTQTIDSATADGFNLTTTFDGSSYTQTWSCTPNGLLAQDLGGPLLATLKSQDLNMSFTITNVSGITYPTEMKPDTQWQHTLEFTGTMDIAGQPTTAEGNIQTIYSANGIEEISISAGKFTALKVEADSTLILTLNLSNLSVPVTISSSYTYWFVEGIGWVQATGEGTATDVPFTETLELQSFTKP